MSKKVKILCLTDHRGHSSENSVYALLRTMLQHPDCLQIDVASRGNKDNDDFFYQFDSTLLSVVQVSSNFEWDKTGQQFTTNTKVVSISDYDWIFLRLPRPIPEVFFEFLMSIFPEERIFNRPSGIIETSSKAFLLEVADICPPMQLIHNQASLEVFKAKFPIVLKPFLNYGGKGILKIKDDLVWEGQHATAYTEWIAAQNSDNLEYLGMQYMENVHLGDKRIIVCNGHILTAAIRYPAEGSWMCNVAQGGHSAPSEPTAEEYQMIEQLTPILLPKGIIIYGVDTLAGPDGKRRLSEINTLSIGGIAPSGQNVVQKAVDAIWEFITQHS
jgi:glutathione synthase